MFTVIRYSQYISQIYTHLFPLFSVEVQLLSALTPKTKKSPPSDRHAITTPGERGTSKTLSTTPFRHRAYNTPLLIIVDMTK